MFTVLKVCASFYSAEYPDLSKHHNVMRNHLTPGVYAKLRDRVTPNGVTLDTCIQTGVDNPGHPFITTVGLVAGDEESYEVNNSSLSLKSTQLTQKFACLVTMSPFSHSLPNFTRSQEDISQNDVFSQHSLQCFTQVVITFPLSKISNHSFLTHQTFKELFYPVIKERHNGYDPETMVHPIDLNHKKLVGGKLDEK